MSGLKVKLLMIIGLTSFFATIANAEDILIKDVAVSVMDVYVPGNFQAGQDAYVVVNGLFPNSCYSLGTPLVKNIDDYTHEIRTMAKVRSGICLRVLVPYNQEISLGALKSGLHTLKFSADDDTYFEKTMAVK
jgi:hypothetical protein